jgi:hypothetical protein
MLKKRTQIRRSKPVAALLIIDVGDQTLDADLR